MLGTREVKKRTLHIDETGNQDERMVRFYDYADAACGGGYVCSYFVVVCCACES